MKEEQEEKVAVIAVHGVAYHAPGQSVRDVAGILTPLRDCAYFLKYSPFTEETIRIAVREVDADLLNAKPACETPDIAFSRRLLQGYQPEGADALYETTRLRGYRVRQGNDNSYHQTPVDIYELYWNDLSKVAGGQLGPLNTLYLLLFHLSDLGFDTIKQALGKQKSAWLNWAPLFGGTRWLFTVAVPHLNLILLMLLIGVVPLAQGPSTLRLGISIFGAVVGLASGGALAYLRGRKTLGNGGNFLLLLLGGALGAAGFFLSQSLDDDALPLTATISGGLLVAAGLAFLFRRFNDFRPGSLAVGLTLLFLVWSSLGAAILRQGAERGYGKSALATAFLQVALQGLLLMMVIWLLFLALAAITMLWGALWNGRSKSDGRAWWTAWITLWVPAALFLYLTETIWLIFGAAVPELLKSVPVDMTRLYPESMKGLVDFFMFHGQKVPPELAQTAYPLGAGLSLLILHVVRSSYWSGLGILASSAIPALWAFLPSVLDELKQGKDAPRSRADDGQGNWLTQGFRALKLSGILVCVSVVSRPWLPGPVPLSTGIFLGISSGATLAMVAGALISRVSRLFSALGTVVGVALDVDNHLRSVPTDRTPRAQMGARYASLLRYLVRQGYTRIIVVAHSQGTVLTADLLRLLTAYADQDLQELFEHTEPSLFHLIQERRIALMTMGSPLRQLYALRFPELYAWAVSPRPDALGVASWLNFYRTGDYVGRGLWVDNADNSWERQPEPQATVEETWEQNIGRGAHTHYWDASAPEVAQELDRLILGPASGAAPPSPAAHSHCVPGGGEIETAPPGTKQAARAGT